MARGRPERGLVGRAVDVDVALEGVDVATLVAARLAAREPQDSREDPVTFRVPRGEAGVIRFSAGTPRHEYRITRRATSDLDAQIATEEALLNDFNRKH